jgi:methylated-DNA-[protein]-cysteine S-methyltransferase
MVKTIDIIKDKIKKYPVFYQKVWLACLEIPFGETRSYSWIAEKIGCPGAYRAVGRALSKNPFPKIIPCHRVIYKNGKLGGYTYRNKKRLDIKEKLLSLEKKL